MAMYIYVELQCVSIHSHIDGIYEVNICFCIFDQYLNLFQTLLSIKFALYI